MQILLLIAVLSAPFGNPGSGGRWIGTATSNLDMAGYIIDNVTAVVDNSADPADSTAVIRTGNNVNVTCSELATPGTNEICTSVDSSNTWNVKSGSTVNLSVSTSGTLTTAGSILSGTSVRAASASPIFWASRAAMGSSGDGKIQLSPNAATTGVTLDTNTNGTLAVKTFGDATGATVTATKFSSDGANVATTGVLNFANNNTTSVCGRNAANSADICMYVNGSNEFQFPAGFSQGAFRGLTLQSTTTGASGIGMTGAAMTWGSLTQTSINQVRTAWHDLSWTNAMVTALGAVTSGDVLAFTTVARTNIMRSYILVLTSCAGVTTLTVSFGRTGASYTDKIPASDIKAAADTLYGNDPAERGANWDDDFVSKAGLVPYYLHFESTGGNLSAVTSCTGSLLFESAIIP